ncbi:Spo0E family sporulation regulatory protein-aspartic acid phosphatase [Paenibacillus lycopersici]|uniref:Spo0E family sporulation regulatory protein-aspartic acid phosphatase n=1 Tax=Paenibacillus lycopersici TaxID=2704462 RepID=A0A6C0FUG1_9BACL|nr:aspartyl-phosphate phosphatase Spo0E family protein [Paenibacillus lycopersici]QHT60477.1 Spo0E family sporulation regulatory protein-aspartic acid phosphatase [Paenibacillus lycopersici]
MDKQSYHLLERLRGQLIAATMRHGSFLNRDVLLLSQTLDQLIVKVQREKMRNPGSAQG